VIADTSGKASTSVLTRTNPPRPALLDRGAKRGDELTKLAQLRDSGVLTEEEFGVQKARLLA
jgi:hypothetical protein